MIALRSALFYLGFSLWSLIWGVVILFFIPLSRRARSWACGFWARMAARWLAIACGLRYRVSGLEHIPADACVIVANHQSALETLLLWEYFPHISFVLKRELFRIPVVGWALPLSWPIGIAREQGRHALRQVLEQGKERLAEGFHILIFPEGTRHACGQVGRFASTAAGLALQAGAPMLPVAHNCGCFWPRGQWRKYPGTVEVRIGPPLQPRGHSPAELNHILQERIRAEVTAMGPRRPPHGGRAHS